MILMESNVKAYRTMSPSDTEYDGLKHDLSRI